MMMPADPTQARSWNLFVATQDELLYGSGLKAILEALAGDEPGFGEALGSLLRRQYHDAAVALSAALMTWTPRTTAQQRELGILTMAAWLLARRQLNGADVWPATDPC